MKQFAYQSYTGTEPFLLLKACKADKSCALSLADKLAAEGVRVFLDIGDTPDAQPPEQTADAIGHCDGAIFFLSEKGCENLELRNAVNYTLAIKKDIFCLKTDEKALSYGMDMQLANANVVSFDSETVLEELRRYEFLTQNVMGGGMEHKNVNRKKQWIFAGLTVVIAAMLVLGGFFIRQRVEYYRSAEYVFRNADGSDYINIASYGNEGIAALAGKSVKELDLSDGGFTDLNGIRMVAMETLDISGNPQLTDLHEIFYCEGLQRLVISQDMLEAANSYPRNSIQIIVTS